MTDKEKEHKLVLECKMLEAMLTYHKYMYYVLAKPEMTDYDFDRLEKHFGNCCQQLEENYPTVYISMNRPKPWVGHKE